MKCTCGHEFDVETAPRLTHRLKVGDSTSVDDVGDLMRGETADCLCWDPPFNVGFKYEGEFKGHDNKTASEYGAWIKKCLERFRSIAKDNHVCFVWQGMTNIRYFAEWFNGNEWRLIAVAKGFVQARPTWLQWATDPVIAWSTDKSAKPISHRDWFYNGQSANTKPTEDRKLSGLHPCPRSVEVCDYFIGGWTEAGDAVCDLSVGSGTTAVACEQLGRECRMMEIDPGYSAVALQRLSDMGCIVEKLK